jgi:16S rRNA (cytosine1402-N4)-methyltransferase
MESEVVELMRGVPPGLLVDATVGGGGHATALLRALPAHRLLGIDRDDAAVRASEERLARFGGRAVVRHARFDAIAELVSEVAGEGARVAGFLFDLGVSSPQLDDVERGFSYRADAPLDMRMDRDQSRTAADLVNDLSEQELAELLATHGEERFARRIARAMVANRPIATTGRLAEIVSYAVPVAARRRGHPARRVFQALRVAVNEELEVLGPALDTAVELLVAGGRCVVISYHSGEDRLVKERFAVAASGGCTCPPKLPCVCGAVPTVRLLTRGAKLPTGGEVDRNPRAEAARLRAVERLPEGEDAA